MLFLKHLISLFNHQKNICEKRLSWLRSKKEVLSNTRKQKNNLDLPKNTRHEPLKNIMIEWWIKIWNFQFKEKTVCKRKGWRMDERCVLRPTVKHGGSIMVWGCLTANGVGDLVKIDGIMNTEKYRQILIHHPILLC